MRRQIARAAALSAVLLTAACQNPNAVAMKVGAPPESAVELRELETRRFSTLDQQAMMAAATQTLQDLGFTITESSVDAGVLVGSKQRDAEETGQVAGQIVLTVLLAAMGSAHHPVWDKTQDIHITVVATPIENSKQIEMRVSFDRYLTNSDGLQWRAELIKEPDIYQEFFDKLSQSAFLEAHKI
jgi:hypothetical protein